MIQLEAVHILLVSIAFAKLFLMETGNQEYDSAFVN